MTFDVYACLKARHAEWVLLLLFALCIPGGLLNRIRGGMMSRRP